MDFNYFEAVKNIKMIELDKISTKPPAGLTKSGLKKERNALLDELESLQNLLVAESKHSLLVVLQGMDASGKDGLVRKVFREVSPAGVRVHSFKKPTDLEFAHDFLWRAHQVAPQKGMIQVFNRSHYEDILIQRVHNWIDADRVKQRIKHINNFEELLLEENNTQVLKFYLHVSKEEQQVRLQERIDLLRKNWKHNDGDWEERKHWDKYMEAYHTCFAACSPAIPWHIVPADENYYKEYVVLKTIVETLRGLNMQFPAIEKEA